MAEREEIWYGFDDKDGLTEFMENQVVGQSVERVDGSRIYLSNGTVVEFHGYGDCCAWGDLDELKQLVSGDNIITSVSVIESDEEYDYTTEFFLYCAGIPVVSGTMSGGEGSGYYSFGVNIQGKVVA